MDKLERIHKEIEQKLSRYEKKYEELARYEVWITAKEIEQRIKELKDVLSIINAIEEEPVSEELEEAAKKYGTKKHPMTTIGANESAYDFKAGAEWQKIKDVSERLKKEVSNINNSGIVKEARVIPAMLSNFGSSVYNLEITLSPDEKGLLDPLSLLKKPNIKIMLI